MNLLKILFTNSHCTISLTLDVKEGKSGESKRKRRDSKISSVHRPDLPNKLYEYVQEQFNTLMLAVGEFDRL